MDLRVAFLVWRLARWKLTLILPSPELMARTSAVGLNDVRTASKGLPSAAFMFNCSDIQDASRINQTGTLHSITSRRQCCKEPKHGSHWRS